MDSPSSTRKLFHVVVVLGMGSALGAAGCSGTSTTSQQDASADATNDAKTGNDAAVIDATPTGDASADSCAGWAPCC